MTDFEWIQAGAIPLYVLGVVVEAKVLTRRGRKAYDRKDTRTNILLGIGYLVTSSVMNLPGLFALSWVQRHSLGLFSSTWLGWAVAMVLVDFSYYWYHRISHGCRWFWNSHVVHHSSQFYNLSVAVRQPWLGALTSWLFFGPLIFLGVPLEMFATCFALNLFYQFWIHTPVERSWGWFEGILNTPSHHRVHHGVDPEYLDKNYGGVLIVWDRVFGSFQAERRTPRYGITHPVRSENLLWINVHGWAETLEEMQKHRGFFAKMATLFGPTDFGARQR